VFYSFYRLYEQGRVDEAEKEKQRLEQKQRENRKLMEQRKEKWDPSWFSLIDGRWRYDPTKNYFASRGKFCDRIYIFDD
jgi:hypothetical protein